MTARSKRKPAPWTEAHRREALRRMREIAAICATSTDGSERAVGHGMLRNTSPSDEAGFRIILAESAYMTAARIDREVARVRALAEGRLVRETVWACKTAAMGIDRPEMVTDERTARRWLSTRCQGDSIVRVTRIRKASP